MAWITWLELIKIGKRRFTWVLLLLPAVAVAVIFLGFFALIVSGTVPISGANGHVASSSTLLPHFILPGAVPEVLSLVQGLGTWALVILTATIVGMEESYGTVRTIVSTGLGRGRYLAGKLVALLVVTVVCVAVALGVGVVSAVVIGSLHPPIQPVSVEGSAVAASVGMTLRTVGVLCFPVAVTFAATVVGRSQVIGIVVGLGVSLVDTLATSVLHLLGVVGRSLSPIVPAQDIAAVMARNHFGYASIPSALPAVSVAELALVGYACLCIGASWLVFCHRDITSNSG